MSNFINIRVLSFIPINIFSWWSISATSCFFLLITFENTVHLSQSIWRNRFHLQSHIALVRKSTLSQVFNSKNIETFALINYRQSLNLFYFEFIFGMGKKRSYQNSTTESKKMKMRIPKWRILEMFADPSHKVY